MSNPMYNTIMLTNSEMMEMVGNIIEVFDDFLEDKGIVIENPERDGEDIDLCSNIYGTDYGDISNRLEEVLDGWGVFNENNFVN